MVFCCHHLKPQSARCDLQNLSATVREREHKAMTAFLFALILAIWLLGLKTVALIILAIFVGIGSACGIGAMWFAIGEGR